MDADALIKLTKSRAKAPVVAFADVDIPMAVKVETVDQAKARGYPDAVAIEENIRAGGLKVVDIDSEAAAPQAELFSTGGDRALFLAYNLGGWNAVVSDDGKLTRLLRALGIPALTPATLLVLMARGKAASVAQVKSLLGALEPLVSAEEYATASLALEALGLEEDYHEG